MKHKYLLGAVFVCAVHAASAQSILENKNEEELSLMLQEVVVTFLASGWRLPTQGKFAY